MKGRLARFAPYAMLSPLLLLFAAFFVYPLLRSLWLSLHVTLGDRSAYVGIANYRFLLTDRLFWWAVANTVGYTIIYLIVQIPACLGLAVLLNNARLRGRSVLRFAFFSTYLVGPIFAGTLFAQILSPRDGPLAELLTTLFGQPVEIPWLTDRRLAMASVLIASWWLSIGAGMVYCLAALQAIPRMLYDAAAMDGAGPWSQFAHVTLPGVRPILGVLALLGAIGALQLFELPVQLFGGPGPGLGALTIVMYLFNAGFETGNAGLASAVGWVLVGLTGAVTAIILYCTRRGRRS
ncbi:MAG TPA: sugar ABC transporter permease [Tepidisphaeraceae bacterium]|jgi:ABC-type sugar transport system permease subunit|nr:sugar ABC transporter permease [Tepidisphaeraceae bacterium]